MASQRRGGATGVALLTGFEAFGEQEDNPTAAIAHHLDGARIDDTRVVSEHLPVSAEHAPRALLSAIERHEPDLVLSLGLANGRSMLALERVAINVLDFPLPDNDGYQAAGEPILPAGPAAYFTSLPIKAILARWREAGIPGYISNTAGTYLCNQTFYVSLHSAAARGARAGLIHVPYLPDQASRLDAGTPSMGLDTMIAGVRNALEVSSQRAEDLVFPAGAVA
jgi:pyroglutamyl-peptidase